MFARTREQREQQVTESNKRARLIVLVTITSVPLAALRLPLALRSGAAVGARGMQSHLD